MKLFEQIIIILFVMTFVVFCGVMVYTGLFVDSTPPVITCEEGIPSVSVHAGSEALLQGVTAYDRRDGDLTDQIIVNGVTGLLSGNTAKVTYIVFDSAGNMAEAHRRVHYSDYRLPQFSLTQPLVFPLNGSTDILKRLHATDVIDGDLSSVIHVTSQNLDRDNEDVYTMVVQVTNSLGDSATLPLRITISSSAAALLPVTLSQYIAYVEAGSSFDPYAYLTSAQNANGPVALSGVLINSGVDVSTPGNYEVTYTYGGYTAYLAVVVQ